MNKFIKILKIFGSIIASVAFIFIVGHNCHASEINGVNYNVLEDQHCDNISGLMGYDTYILTISTTTDYLFIPFSYSNANFTIYWNNGTGYHDIIGLNGIPDAIRYSDGDFTGQEIYLIPMAGYTGTFTIRVYLTGGAYGIYNLSIIEAETPDIYSKTFTCETDEEHFYKTTDNDSETFLWANIMTSGASLLSVNNTGKTELQTTVYNACSYSTYKIHTMGWAGDNSSDTIIFTDPTINHKDCALKIEYDYITSNNEFINNYYILGEDDYKILQTINCQADEEYCDMGFVYSMGVFSRSISSADKWLPTYPAFQWFATPITSSSVAVVSSTIRQYIDWGMTSNYVLFSFPTPEENTQYILNIHDITLTPIDNAFLVNVEVLGATSSSQLPFSYTCSAVCTSTDLGCIFQKALCGLFKPSEESVLFLVSNVYNIIHKFPVNTITNLVDDLTMMTTSTAYSPYTQGQVNFVITTTTDDGTATFTTRTVHLDQGIPDWWYKVKRWLSLACYLFLFALPACLILFYSI